MQTFYFTGVLLGFIGGSYIPFAVNPWIMLSLPVVYLVGFWFVPDTPQQLLRWRKFEVSALEIVARFRVYRLQNFLVALMTQSTILIGISFSTGSRQIVALLS